MTSNVNIERVRQLEVLGGEYCDRFPPDHYVIVTLEDGVSRTVPLEGYKIDVLIKGIAKEKLINPWEEGHWDAFHGNLNYFQFCTGKNNFPTFDEVMREIFDQLKNKTLCSHNVEISLEDGSSPKNMNVEDQP